MKIFASITTDVCGENLSISFKKSGTQTPHYAFQQDAHKLSSLFRRCLPVETLDELVKDLIKKRGIIE